MAWTLRDAKLDSRSARSRLLVRRAPYWLKLAPGQQLGYRKVGARGGTWLARAYEAATRNRSEKALGAADDILDADGSRVLSYAQAQEKARLWFPTAFLKAEEAEKEHEKHPTVVSAVLLPHCRRRPWRRGSEPFVVCGAWSYVGVMGRS